jgi:hypothetical protein
LQHCSQRFAGSDAIGEKVPLIAEVLHFMDFCFHLL